MERRNNTPPTGFSASSSTALRRGRRRSIPTAVAGSCVAEGGVQCSFLEVSSSSSSERGQIWLADIYRRMCLVVVVSKGGKPRVSLLPPADEAAAEGGERGVIEGRAGGEGSRLKSHSKSDTDS